MRIFFLCTAKCTGTKKRYPTLIYISISSRMNFWNNWSKFDFKSRQILVEIQYQFSKQIDLIPRRQ